MLSESPGTLNIWKYSEGFFFFKQATRPILNAHLEIFIPNLFLLF